MCVSRARIGRDRLSSLRARRFADDLWAQCLAVRRTTKPRAIRNGWSTPGEVELVLQPLETSRDEAQAVIMLRVIVIRSPQDPRDWRAVGAPLVVHLDLVGKTWQPDRPGMQRHLCWAAAPDVAVTDPSSVPTTLGQAELPVRQGVGTSGGGSAGVMVGPGGAEAWDGGVVRTSASGFGLESSPACWRGTLRLLCRAAHREEELARTCCGPCCSARRTPAARAHRCRAANDGRRPEGCVWGAVQRRPRHCNAFVEAGMALHAPRGARP